jgi:alkanesulfonate monooxygenase SsuD/methylene tetrahydromethanopterin reductase-like flavin-dependent oxidoreductase (luciferase family)
MADGKNMGNIEVTQGAVLFLAGENPDDLCGRVHAACQEYGLDPATAPIMVLPHTFPVTPAKARELAEQINATGMTFALIVGDSAPAYFDGENENDNVQMGAYARNWRVLTQECRGQPAVLLLCHPVKNPSKDNLLPRGGGAFLAEVDGNLTLWGETQGVTATLHWQGKLRGVDFQPVNFALEMVKLADHKDKKGRPFVSVLAKLQTAEDGAKAAKGERSEQDKLLSELAYRRGLSIRGLADVLGWVTPTGQCDRSRVARRLKDLAKDKLVKSHRGEWVITAAGRDEIGEKIRET